MSKINVVYDAGELLVNNIGLFSAFGFGRLNENRKNRVLTDFTIRLYDNDGPQRVLLAVHQAHKIILLSSSSDYLRTMIYGGMKEAITNEAEFHGFDPYIFSLVLDLIYGDVSQLRYITNQTLFKILEVAHHLLMDIGNISSLLATLLIKDEELLDFINLMCIYYQSFDDDVMGLIASKIKGYIDLSQFPEDFIEQLFKSDQYYQKDEAITYQIIANLVRNGRSEQLFRFVNFGNLDTSVYPKPSCELMDINTRQNKLIGKNVEEKLPQFIRFFESLFDEYPDRIHNEYIILDLVHYAHNTWTVDEYRETHMDRIFVLFINDTEILEGYNRVLIKKYRLTMDHRFNSFIEVYEFEKLVNPDISEKSFFPLDNYPKLGIYEEIDVTMWNGDPVTGKGIIVKTIQPLNGITYPSPVQVSCKGIGKGVDNFINAFIYLRNKGYFKNMEIAERVYNMTSTRYVEFYKEDNRVTKLDPSVQLTVDLPRFLQRQIKMKKTEPFVAYREKSSSDLAGGISSLYSTKVICQYAWGVKEANALSTILITSYDVDFYERRYKVTIRSYIYV